MAKQYLFDRTLCCGPVGTQTRALSYAVVIGVTGRALLEYDNPGTHLA
jgi:hypothetical protein